MKTNCETNVKCKYQNPHIKACGEKNPKNNSPLVANPRKHRDNNKLAVIAAWVLVGENMLMNIIEGPQCGAVSLSAHIFVTIILTNQIPPTY